MADQSSSRKEFVSRIGTFFVLIGIGMMVFFGLSDAASTPTMSYFCWGTILLTLGFIFQGQFKRPPGPPTGRFRVLGMIKNLFKRKTKEEKGKDKKK
jgi:hypothetical protein